MVKRQSTLILVLLLVLAAPALGQRKSDIGFMVAVPWYLGDISYSVPKPTVIPPAIGPFLRYNFNKRNSLRAHAVLYELGAADEIFDGEPAEFHSSFVDLGLDFEFNWWAYRSAWRKTKFTPYVSAGLGYSLNYDKRSVSHVYIPFGGGFKINLGKRMSGGAEVSMRKTFTDMIDGRPSAGGTENNIAGNNDWYFFTGLFLSYKIFEWRDDCPTYD